MPLFDHSHPPLHPRRHWESFHTMWAASIAGSLNDGLLPEGYFAEVQVHVGGRFEVDVAALAGDPHEAKATGVARGAAVAEAPSRRVAPPAMTMPIVFPDQVEVIVFSEEGGAVLAGAIELVSPGNKDRPEDRTAFAAKCVTYLHKGVGLIVVDIATNRRANLHEAIVGLLGDDGTRAFATETGLYAAAYRPVRRPDTQEVEIWPEALAVGRALPALPLSLGYDVLVSPDLEASYDDACRRLRLT